jgi:hypothetical protein
VPRWRPRADVALANAARDAALAAGKVYVSTTAGLAAVADGEYFSVPSTVAAESLILYRRNGAVATEIKRFPSVLGMQAALGNFTGNGGRLEITPQALSLDSTKVGWYDLTKARMFQDRFGQSPVSAVGQTVGLIVPNNEERGAELVANGGMATSTGYTLGAGWTNSGGKMVAAAANGVLNYPIAAVAAGKRYWIEFDAEYTSGTLQIDLGAGFYNLPVSATGHVEIALVPGGVPASGVYFRATGFTGTIDNLSVKEAGPWCLMAPADAERPTLAVDSNGVLYIDAPTGKDMTTLSAFTLAAPTYMAMALTRATRTALTMASLYSASGYLAIGDQSGGFAFTAGSAKGGATTLPSTRAGVAALDAPTVVDVELKAGTTSVWVNGGESDVLGDPLVLAAGQKRTMANTWDGSEAYTGASFGINRIGSYSAANCKFYGGVVYLGAVTPRQRRQIHALLKSRTMLDVLDEQMYDIFPIAGQSNAMGVGDQSTSTAVPYGNAVEYIDSGYLKALKDPTQHAVEANVSLTGSAWPAFGKKYFELTNRRVCIVGSAYSGEGLVNGAIAGGTWLGPKLSVYLAHKVATAMRNVKGIVRGVIYIGGENDATLSSSVICSASVSTGPICRC